MNSLAIELLEKVYGLDTRNVTMIHHGAPVVPRGRCYTMKSDLKLRGNACHFDFRLTQFGQRIGICGESHALYRRGMSGSPSISSSARRIPW